MMIFGKQDWTKNYFSAIGAEDTRTGNAVLIDAIAKQVSFNKDAVIGVIESSDITIRHDASQTTIIKVLQDNLGTNQKLAKNLTKLLLAEKYNTTVGEIMEKPVKGDGTTSDLANAQESGEVLAGMIGSLFRSSNLKKSDQKAYEAKLAFDKQQEQNKQLEDRVKLYTGATDAAKKNRSFAVTLLFVALAGWGGYYLYKNYWK